MDVTALFPLLEISDDALRFVGAGVAMGVGGAGPALPAQAQEAANRIQEQAREQARREGEALLERARSEIQLERDQAIAELRREFGDLTARAAEKITGQYPDRRPLPHLINPYE